MNDHDFKVVPSGKIFRLTITDDRNWKAHERDIVLKASNPLYILKELKSADVDSISRVKFHHACIRSVLKHGCQTSHSSLPNYSSTETKRIHKRAQKVIYLLVDYDDAFK